MDYISFDVDFIGNSTVYTVIQIEKRWHFSGYFAGGC